MNYWHDNFMMWEIWQFCFEIRLNVVWRGKNNEKKGGLTNQQKLSHFSWTFQVVTLNINESKFQLNFSKSSTKNTDKYAEIFQVTNIMYQVKMCQKHIYVSTKKGQKRVGSRKENKRNASLKFY